MVRVAIHQIVLHLQHEQDTFNLFETSRPALQSTQPIVPLLHTPSSCANKEKKKTIINAASLLSAPSALDSWQSYAIRLMITP